MQDQDRRDEDYRGDPPFNTVVEVGSRIAYAMIAFGATYGLSKWLHLEDESAKEIAILNGGLAYYTHEVAGRVVRAVNRVYMEVAKIPRGRSTSGRSGIVHEQDAPASSEGARGDTEPGS